jgi:hypothetical protein
VRQKETLRHKGIRRRMSVLGERFILFRGADLIWMQDDAMPWELRFLNLQSKNDMMRSLDRKGNDNDRKNGL